MQRAASIHHTIMIPKGVSQEPLEASLTFPKGHKQAVGSHDIRHAWTMRRVQEFFRSLQASYCLVTRRDARHSSEDWQRYFSM